MPWHTSSSSQPVLYGGHVRLGSYFHKRSFGAISFVNLLGAAATGAASQNRFIAHFILLYYVALLGNVVLVCINTIF